MSRFKGKPCVVVFSHDGKNVDFTRVWPTFFAAYVDQQTLLRNYRCDHRSKDSYFAKIYASDRPDKFGKPVGDELDGSRLLHG